MPAIRLNSVNAREIVARLEWSSWASGLRKTEKEKTTRGAGLRQSPTAAVATTHHPKNTGARFPIIQNPFLLNTWLDPRNAPIAWAAAP